MESCPEMVDYILELYSGDVDDILDLYIGVEDFKGKHNRDVNTTPYPHKEKPAGLWKTLHAVPQCLTVS